MQEPNTTYRTLISHGISSRIQDTNQGCSGKKKLQQDINYKKIQMIALLLKNKKSYATYNLLVNYQKDS